MRLVEKADHELSHDDVRVQVKQHFADERNKELVGRLEDHAQKVRDDNFYIADFNTEMKHEPMIFHHGGEQKAIQGRVWMTRTIKLMFEDGVSIRYTEQDGLISKYSIDRTHHRGFR